MVLTIAAASGQRPAAAQRGQQVQPAAVGQAQVEQQHIQR
jgi:hypothetical protein